MTALEKILWDMKVTAGARFNASARLARKNKRSNTLLAIYSAILICISATTLTFTLAPWVSRLISVGGLFASILLLVMSMNLFSDQAAVDSEQMHRCALEINEQRRLISALPVSEAENRLAEFASAYNAVLNKFSINQTEGDYRKYKFSHRWEFDDLRELDEKTFAKRERVEERRMPAFSFELLSGAGMAAIAGLLLSLVATILGL